VSEANQAMSEAARLRIMAARIIAQIRWPYISSALFSLKLVESEPREVPTMAVDSGWRLYYSVDFVLGENSEALATVLLHEALHCVMSHNQRFENVSQEGRNPLLWNICGDCAINDILDEQDMPWTEKVTPVRYSDYTDVGIESSMITETAYEKMRLWKQENSKQSDSRFEQTDCGSVTGGSKRSYELEKDDPDAPSMHSEEQEGIRDRVASDVLSSGASRSDIPGGLVRWANSHLDPQVNWRKQLGVSIRRAVASVAGRKDYTFSRPSRRQEAMRLISSSVILPSLRQPAPPRVAVVVDTSGSISDSDLKSYLAEVSGIVRAVSIGGGVQVIACDSKAAPPQLLKSANRIEQLQLVGGGGTDMREGIYAALKTKPNPDVVVIVTDGATPWPDNKPRGCDFYTAVLTKESSQSSVPYWMQKVLIN
jgi:predicted metal-dependent peptidase